MRTSFLALLFLLGAAAWACVALAVWPRTSWALAPKLTQNPTAIVQIPASPWTFDGIVTSPDGALMVQGLAPMLKYYEAYCDPKTLLTLEVTDVKTKRRYEVCLKR